LHSPGSRDGVAIRPEVGVRAHRRYRALSGPDSLAFVDFAKLDAPLAAALETGSDDARLEISIRTAPLGDHERLELKHLGVRGVEPGRTTFSASVTPDAARRMSEKPWVRRLSLAQQLRPLAR